MLKIDVQNFRGIRSAGLMCAPIALVCGRNEQGKSSIVDAVRATLMGEQQPYGLKKDELPAKLVFRGQTGAAVRITDQDEGRETVMTWPAGDVETTGAPFRATPVAAGLVRFTRLNDRDRAKMLAEYLKTSPDAEEFLLATHDCGLDKGALDAVWQDVKQQGWDGAWEKQKTEGTKLKGAWDHLTGAKWGKTVGGNWRPKGWGPDHEGMTDDEIATDLKETKDALEAAIGTVAINEGEKKRLEGLSANIPKLQQLLKTRETDGKQAKAALEQAERDLQAIPVLEPDNWPCCPHCKKPVAVRAGAKGQSVLEIPKKALDAKERDKIANQTEDAQRVFDEARQKYDEARNTYEVCAKDLRAAQDGKAQLEQSNPDAKPVNIDELRAEVRRAEGFAAAKQKIRDAVKKHSEVMARLAVVEVLAPEGLRQTKLTEKLGQFNESLESLCDVAGWGPVVIGADLGVTLNGYRYELCATSGQMRIDVTLQCALAIRDGSEVLLVDDADQLDPKGRNGLFALLAHTERYCVVGMMLGKSPTAPDLAELEMGGTWWVEQGEAYEIGEYKAAHAA